MDAEPRFLTAGDQSLLVEFGDEISPEANVLVNSLKHAIENAGLPGIRETVPTYRTLILYYDPLVVDLPGLKDALQKLSYRRDGQDTVAQSPVEIPVVYGGVSGPDLNLVAESHGLTPDEVVEIHISAVYTVYMNGFMPGFPYLGGLSPRIATPRLKTPRLKVPAGSVGIAGNQTGIYPSESPGGWQIIGRTPLRLFDPCKMPPALLPPGSEVKFVCISADD